MVRPKVNRRLSVPGQSPAEDRLLAMVAALTSELAITRERLDTLERLVAEAGVVPLKAIDEYVPDVEALRVRDNNRQRLIAKVFRPLKEDATRAAENGVGTGEKIL